ncbi:hypothetical protein WICANDRAFT_27657 [Wickerhamomyces anomalus NRRL Y-366-8]|uniref:RWD domain-containing protein n=1 Tax=Wickerhamomyces anomalus (strain ATCC 58044 / CBS 1984 / NCYC 433 / NRRL Y-366-8) TaxID=683960 RepID=A0A1E3P5C0_WICAA|nr:uncharacterized protein WICANDRAFT_27657 [Wickerhamomyces anomalus NRRL Y-366-8]ODQ60635.1 hypothetical protein WICANDRAFT_27657 [Wickerhamomyces anomalus NRRL Y-366-8]
MDYKEEQQQEIEILQSIYPDELEVVSENEYTITLLLDTVSERKHRVILHVKYPETYPEDEDNDEPKLVLISEQVELDQDDLDEIKSNLMQEAEDQIGIPSVFALASSLKDQAEQVFENKVNAKQKQYDDALLAKEREEQKKFSGTKVTVESFNSWRLKFRAEMGINDRIEKRKKMLHRGKLSGKEIFEKGLAGDDETLEELGGDVATKLAV